MNDYNSHYLFNRIVTTSVVPILAKNEPFASGTKKNSLPSLFTKEARLLIGLFKKQSMLIFLEKKHDGLRNNRNTY